MQALFNFQTSFNAFKIPESNFLVFEATVNTCRGGCQPVSLNNEKLRHLGDTF